MVSLIQHFEADFLWKVSLKILNSGIILKTFTHVNYTPPYFILLTCSTPVISMYLRSDLKSVDPDQIALSEVADQDLQCFQKQINLGSARHGLIFILGLRG